VPLPPGLPDDCEVTMPDGALYRPAQAGGSYITAPSGEEPGYLSVSCGERWEIAVNPDCGRESDLDYLATAEAADSLGVVEFAEVSAGPQVAQAVDHARQGKEIAGALAAAAILLLAVELVVAQAGRAAGGEEDA